MKPKTIILMVVAVVCGLVASYMTSRVIADRNHNAGPGEEEKVTILVAKGKIPFGILIKDPKKYFVEKSLNKGDEPKKAIKTWEQVQDKRLNKALADEQFITSDDLLDPKTSSGVEGLLPQGMRGVALKVNAASVVAGFVLPNSRVDVIQTNKNGEHSTTQTILQNMLVLASDAMIGRPDDKQSNMASTVTVAAKPEDVQKLRLAEGIGELSLALRGPEDQEIVTLKETRPADLARGRGKDNGSTDDSETGGSTGGTVSRVPDAPVAQVTPAPAKPEEPPPAPPKTITQIIYNGESVTKTLFVLSQGEISTQVEKTGLEREPRPEKKEPAAQPAQAPPEAGPKKDANPAGKPDGTK